MGGGGDILACPLPLAHASRCASLCRSLCVGGAFLFLVPRHLARPWVGTLAFYSRAYDDRLNGRAGGLTMAEGKWR